ncbi:TAT (twin-arginine translocation) pathway-exported protein [Kribbella antiqua]|uniref:TAT (Twin-arginine translocation) pathway-exported protein n=1 Tax=Kribbella antiqua TaxID=2512217 RepID=A0A4R2IXB9_9ACTN|nr:alginate lyase family protein [Kribbella antiqua]TCO50441.1 TAT (twin-arginine translocation) pathway-exported protein [Kribbella antiqua]
MREFNRRTLLKGTAGAAAAAAGITMLDGPATAAPATFTHPGALHNWGDLNRAKVRVAAGTDPWLSGYYKLIANSHAQSGWAARPQATVIRGGTGENYGLLYNDIAAAYQNALRWWITGSTAHGDTARNILNAWSSTLTSIGGNADRFLAAGLYGYQFANVAELMRGYSGFDLARFKTMMLNVFYPMNNSFLNNHNDACITNYWANWDLCNMNSILAIAILCDDAAKYDQAVNYFKTGAGNGSIKHAVPFVYDSEGLAQWQESGRDQGHTVMGIGQMGAFCEMAWNQGEDLYGYDNNRFMKAAQYVAKYNLGQDVPFTKYTWGTGQSCAYQEHTVISSASRGQLRPVWEILHFHYTRRKYLSVPYISQMAAQVRPEGGGGDYGSTSGGFDQTGFGTVMYAK